MSTHLPDARAHSRRRLALPAACLLVSGLMAWIAPGSAVAQQPGNSGPNDDITDVPGITVGHKTNEEAHTGTTVVFARNSGTGGVDVRGGAPLTRETDLLAPTNEVQKLNAVMLTGGGEYGLAAGPGVMQWLNENDTGFQVGLINPDEVVPIVPGAAINDLRAGRDRKVRPDARYGYEAIAGASGGPIAQGNVGAGAGAVAGGLKGGVGSASVEVAPGIYIGALVVVDSLGTPADLTSGCSLLGAQYAMAGDFTGYQPPPGGCGRYRVPAPPTSGEATTRGAVIGVVATNVTMDKAMNQKVAEVAHDGVTRALSAAHGMTAGDTFFSVSTDLVNPGPGALPSCLESQIRNTAIACQLFYQLMLGEYPDVVSKAVARAMLSARSVPDLAPSYCDTFAGACSEAATGGPPAAPVAPAAEQVVPAVPDALGDAGTDAVQPDLSWDGGVVGGPQRSALLVGGAALLWTALLLVHGRRRPRTRWWTPRLPSSTSAAGPAS